MFNDKVTKSVADAASKIMAEELKGNQHKIDKNKNNKIDAHDFKMLRKEDSEQLDELSKGTLTSCHITIRTVQREGSARSWYLCRLCHQPLPTAEEQWVPSSLMKRPLWCEYGQKRLQCDGANDCD